MEPSMPYKDKAKQREAQARWARENPANRKREYDRRTQIVNDAKAVPCLTCGVQYHPAVMDLHHVDPSTKKAAISALVARGKQSEIHEEIEKCVVLCANCHRLLHAGQIKLPS